MKTGEDDLKRALDWCLFLAEHLGLTGEVAQRQAKRYLHLMEGRARKMLNDRGIWHAVEAIAFRLLEKRKISGPEARRLYRREIDTGGIGLPLDMTMWSKEEYD